MTVRSMCDPTSQTGIYCFSLSIVAQTGLSDRRAWRGPICSRQRTAQLRGVASIGKEGPFRTDPSRSIPLQPVA